MLCVTNTLSNTFHHCYLALVRLQKREQYFKSVELHESLCKFLFRDYLTTLQEKGRLEFSKKVVSRLNLHVSRHLLDQAVFYFYLPSSASSSIPLMLQFCFWFPRDFKSLHQSWLQCFRLLEVHFCSKAVVLSQDFQGREVSTASVWNLKLLQLTLLPQLCVSFGWSVSPSKSRRSAPPSPSHVAYSF